MCPWQLSWSTDRKHFVPSTQSGCIWNIVTAGAVISLDHHWTNLIGLESQMLNVIFRFPASPLCRWRLLKGFISYYGNGKHLGGRIRSSKFSFPQQVKGSGEMWLKLVQWLQTESLIKVSTDDDDESLHARRTKLQRHTNSRNLHPWLFGTETDIYIYSKKIVRTSLMHIQNTYFWFANLWL